MVEYTCPICSKHFIDMRGIVGLFAQVMDHMTIHIQEASSGGSGGAA